MEPTARQETVIVLDFGSQYAQLIARRVREEHVYAHILPCTASIEKIREFSPVGIILSGGPANVYGKDAPRCAPEVFGLGVPVFGICYGTQLMCEVLGGKVLPAEQREFGQASIDVVAASPVFQGLDTALSVWMSHGDQVERLPEGFTTVAKTSTCPHAAIQDPSRKMFGVQFHPEVHHTPQGRAMLRNFLYEVCGVHGIWKMSSFIDETVREVREKVGSAHVVLGLSGGVDSSVVALLLHKALGDQVTAIFVDNGVLRYDEAAKVEKIYREQFHLNMRFVDAREQFFEALKGVEDPELKRKAIGRVFIDVFMQEAKSIPDVKFLAQGTLYPDVIESISAHGGPTAVIKSHHNVGGLPEKLGVDLVEPLRFLFKDEVRALGEELGMSEEMVWRHPFPGPGLAVRILGEVTPQRVETLQLADRIVMEEIKAAGLYRKVWQAFAVFLPIRSVGVMGDERTYDNACAIRIVESTDGMTCDWSRIPYDVLGRMSTRIINEVKGINRVVYDISQKPPATIEWE